ncbi:MAG TPA: SDR family NAD(P)-dependent oxidoreductase, partial [Kineobactrum sp.]
MALDYFQLSNKIALVTGASSGLGLHFARVLAHEGATVILAARRVEKLEQEVAAIRATGGQADSVAMDVSSPGSVEQAFADIAARHG